jgi:phospholipid transport system substrate-binding protein
VQVAPLQAKPDADDVTVKTLVREPGRQPVAINYRMASKAEGWKVYDVLVENVSLVSTYRGSFAEEIARSGVDGLIKALDNKNRSNGSIRS